MEQIKEILSKVMTNISLGKPEIQNKIQKIWHAVFDEKTSKHTAIVGLQKGKLIVHVDSPAWLFQMNLQKRKILEKLKEEIPELSLIQFKIGKVK